MDYLSIKSVLAEKYGKGFENRLKKKGSLISGLKIVRQIIQMKVYKDWFVKASINII